MSPEGQRTRNLKGEEYKARKAISDGSAFVFVSAVTAWEIAIKKAIGKLEVPNDLEEALNLYNFHPLPITFSHALLAGHLPLHHDDPFDRMLISQAMIEGLTLVTRDKKQMLYEVSTIAA